MAYFTQNDFERLDFKLLQDSFVTLYFRPQFFAENILGLKKLGYLTVEFDASSWKSESDFYDAIAGGLKFPDYFGRNLNALNDCLYDIEIPPDSGLVIAFLKFDLFQTQYVDFKEAILDHIAITACYHLLLGKRLICLVQSSDPKISFENLGARPAVWNSREWLNKNRGL